MATHRVVEKTAGTGERSGSLSHLGFRVWIQYMLSADDYGICPAEAAKFQGDNPALNEEPMKKVQDQIEVLVKAGLCGVFKDGKRRYLYQTDWQTYQRIKHPTKTALPPIPAELLEKCCAKTRELFLQNHPKIVGEFRLHGNSNSNANAYANAYANANAAFELAPVEAVQKHHPVKEFLAEHERLFKAKYGADPAKYTEKDAKHAKDITQRHGFDVGIKILRRFFESSEPFIAKSGHGIGVLASGAVQNRVIAELSGKGAKGDGMDGLREFVSGG